MSSPAFFGPNPNQMNFAPPNNGKFIYRKVDFDVDDTLLPYTKTIAESLDIPYASWTDFHMLNPNYTDQQKGLITRAYCDPSYYAQIQFYPGFKDILELERHGAILRFNSISHTQMVLDSKQQKMMNAIPMLQPEHFRFCLSIDKDGVQKKFDDDVFIVVDDNHHAVAESKAPFAIMPATPWNQTDKAKEMVKHKIVYYTPEGDLHTIYQIIRLLLWRSTIA